MQTPYTPDGLRQYDELETVVAILRAWTVAGPNPGWHEAARDRVRAAMPLLGRALDRLAGMDPDALVSYLGVQPRDPLPDDPPAVVPGQVYDVDTRTYRPIESTRTGERQPRPSRHEHQDQDDELGPMEVLARELLAAGVDRLVAANIVATTSEAMERWKR